MSELGFVLRFAGICVVSVGTLEQLRDKLGLNMLIKKALYFFHIAASIVDPEDGMS